jgi:hypothetical protein
VFLSNLSNLAISAISNIFVLLFHYFISLQIPTETQMRLLACASENIDYYKDQSLNNLAQTKNVKEFISDLRARDVTVTVDNNWLT